MTGARKAWTARREDTFDLLESAGIRLDSFAGQTVTPERDLHLAGQECAQATAQALILIADALNGIRNELTKARR